MNRVQILLANKHTTLSAAAYVAAKLTAQLGSVWMPEHKDKFDQTAGLIESAAVGWGLLMAGDAKPSSPSETETKV